MGGRTKEKYPHDSFVSLFLKVWEDKWGLVVVAVVVAVGWGGDSSSTSSSSSSNSSSRWVGWG